MLKERKTFKQLNRKSYEHRSSYFYFRNGICRTILTTSTIAA